MTAYHLILLLCPMGLLGSLTQSREAHRTLLAIAVTFSVAFCGLRWNSDVDYQGYALLFADTPLLGNFTPDAVSELYGEPGYLFLSSLLRTAGLGFIALTVLCAAFSITVKALVIKQFVRPAGIVLFLYLCIHFITIEFIQIRWAVASALIALAFSFQYQRRLVPSLVCLGIAFWFHYFSVVFIAVAALMQIRREDHLYILLAAFGVVVAIAAWRGIEIPVEFEANAYIVQRALRYITDTLSTLGVMSYVKILFYPFAYLGLTAGRPDLHSDSATQFLRRLSVVCIAFTLALSIVPVMHHRTVVLADFASLMLLVRVIELRFTPVERLTLLTVLSIPYGTWFLLDLNANFTAGTLYEFSTWIPLLF